jgi:predicted nucleic acid-binding protein
MQAMVKRTGMSKSSWIAGLIREKTSQTSRAIQTAGRSLAGSAYRRGATQASSPEKRIKQLNSFISVVHILPFGYEEAQHAAAIRVGLEKKGVLIGPYDIFII